MQKVESLINQIADLDWQRAQVLGNELTETVHKMVGREANWKSVATGLIRGEDIDGIINDLECDVEFSNARLAKALDGNRKAVA